MKTALGGDANTAMIAIVPSDFQATSQSPSPRHYPIYKLLDHTVTVHSTHKVMLTHSVPLSPEDVVKCATLLLGIGGVLISHSKAMSPQVVIPLLSETHGKCDARPTVTFPAARHHRPLAGTKLYCLVTEAHVC